MPKPTDIRPVTCELFFLPVQTRMPYGFGAETLTSVMCARVKMTVADRRGCTAEGWGETPLSAGWVWPSKLPFQERADAMQQFCRELTQAWVAWTDHAWGHPLEVGHEFQTIALHPLTQQFNQRRTGKAMPHLAALVCCSPFDIALHDAYGKLHGKPIYEMYDEAWMTDDLSVYFGDSHFNGRFPREYLIAQPKGTLPAWHAVGNSDPLDPSQRTGNEPDDGYPVTLEQWIKRDGLTCLKVKLRGNDAAWDYDRLIHVGHIAIAHDCHWLSTDFNCTATDPAYVNDILDRLMIEHPRIFGMILYVEQPFPYDLEEHRIDVHSVAARKPLFMDESAHDWKFVKLGRSLGWTGVALKTCKTQTGALLSLCWAKAHGMTLMVQDLTNPMLAQIPHVLLAAHAGTIMGVETNGPQFYPEASAVEAKVHPGIYQRRNGQVDLSSLQGPGFGYRVEEIGRELPTAASRVAS